MTIEKEKLYFGVISGAQEVMANKTYLNKINVFPVADGDTGSNLFSTMQSIVTNSEIKSTIKHTLESIADSALTGARGNSGLIFAQYFCGLSEAVGDDDLTAKDFVLASSNGFRYAYDAVDKPVEGTILTTMQVFHESLEDYMKRSNNFISALEAAYEMVVKAVERTTKQLRVLKKASVVDSGAKGFAYFIKGFILGLKGKKQIFIPVEKIPEIKYVHEENFNYRYCTETLIGDCKKIKKEELKCFGDSLIVSGNGKKMRIHIHTDEPVNFFEYLSVKGIILEQKVDDMFLQYERVHKRKYSRVIVTDSIADIPKGYLDDEQVHMIPLTLLIGRVSYFDKLTISNEHVFKLAKQKNVHPYSSQPTIKMVENAYDYLLNYYDEIIVLTVAKALSGTYQVFEKIAKKYDQVHVIDTKQNSVAQGLLLYETMMDLKSNTSTKDMLSKLDNRIKRSKILVQIKSLDPMIASGRLSTKLGGLLKFLGIKPIITLNETGEGAVYKLAFNNKQSYNEILKHIRTIHINKNITCYAISYIDDIELAQKFSGSIELLVGFKPVYITKSSSIIAVGAGSGAVGIGYITERK
ncbi:MAG: DegV family EDD domain-containing protein [Clostridiales bacterium]|nr:DegV family EDD domain-containing protein [Clostridiales bacterium]